MSFFLCLLLWPVLGAALVALSEAWHRALGPAPEAVQSPEAQRLARLCAAVQCAQDVGDRSVLLDAVWEAAREAGARCLLWRITELHGGRALNQTRSDGTITEHALAVLGECPATRAALQQRVPMSTALDTVPQNPAERVLARAGIGAVLAIPLVSEDGVHGVLVVGATSPLAFADETGAYLAALGAVLTGCEVRRTNQKALMRTRQAREQILQCPVTPKAVINAQGMVVSVSPALVQTMDVCAADLVGKPWSTCDRVLGLEPGLAPLIETVLATGAHMRSRTQSARPDGSLVALEWHLSRLADPMAGRDGVLLVGRDVTQVENLQQEVMHWRRLASAGESLAQAAHELKNPLTAVVGFAELLEGELGDGPAAAHLQRLVAQARRCRRIISNLLSFVSSSGLHREPVCLNELVRETVEMLAPQLSAESVEVITGLAEDLPLVMGDAHDLQQLLVNLLTNAQQALATVGGGTVRITTERVGSEVCLTVADDGPGIAAEVLPRLFEPFVTTKRGGLGTGLGLSICQGIAQAHGGRILAGNGTDGGAVFRLVLPQAQIPEAGIPTARCDRAQPQGDPVPTGQRILVIDDEEPLRELMVEALTQEGYITDQTDDGVTALQLIAERDYDLIICDLKMPGLSGEDIYERLGARDPRLAQRMVFVTGDTSSPGVRRFLQRCDCPCVEKPFTLAQLSALVHQQLRALA